MKNGRYEEPEDHDPKIASFEAARRKAEAAKKAAARAERPQRPLGQWIAGGVIVAMALGMIVWWGRALMQSLGLAS